MVCVLVCIKSSIKLSFSNLVYHFRFIRPNVFWYVDQSTDKQDARYPKSDQSAAWDVACWLWNRAPLPSLAGNICTRLALQRGSWLAQRRQGLSGESRAPTQEERGSRGRMEKEGPKMSRHFDTVTPLFQTLFTTRRIENILFQQGKYYLFLVT